MPLSPARRAVRAADGEQVPLHDPDRGSWDQQLIADGQDLVRECLATGGPGPYQLLAAINGSNTDARIAVCMSMCQRVLPAGAAAKNAAAADSSCAARGASRLAGTCA